MQDIRNAPLQHFPHSDTHVLMDGPTGPLEVKINYPAADTLKPGTVVVICHPNPLQQGTMDNKVVHTVMRGFVALGYPVVRFNYRGVGHSGGTYGNFVGELDDLMSVLRWVDGLLPDHRYILAGFSFGTYISAMAEVQWPPTVRLLSVAPPVPLYSGFENITPTCPWTIFAADADEVVPFDQLEHWYLQHPEGKKWVVFDGASHFFHGQLVLLRDKVIQEFS
ncbi:MAG: CocE/NonD family hydrolase [Pseudomonadota bacterium]